METGWIVRSDCTTFKEFASFFNRKGMTPLFFEFSSILKDVERFVKNLNDEYNVSFMAIIDGETYRSRNVNPVSEVIFFVDEAIRDKAARKNIEVKHVDFYVSVYRGTDKKNTKSFNFSIDKIGYNLL